MFYGAFVLAKKGPLAKVWLAAHWDKKLTKAHIFETDVEQTVDDIISPKIKMALRTSGHLLLGVVRIYSRKQKYLIHDLGEACAKIRMAFRPGIVDLPAEGGVLNTDAITLPEIFHDFETAVADLGSFDVVDQFTINPSRASEITIAEDVTTTGGDVFGGEFGEFDLGGGEFGGGMEDIEVPRNSKTVAFADDKNQTDRTSLQVSDLTNGTTLQEGGDKDRDFILEDQLPDRGDFGGGDFLEDGFGFGDGGMGEFGGVPNVSDIALEEAQKPQEEEGEAGKDRETAMEVDQPPQEQPAASKQPSVTAGDQDQTLGGDTTVIPMEEEGFVLEPIEESGTKERRTKRKRKLVVDNQKELTSDMIKEQLDDCSDTVHAMCAFPPPTKKALSWREVGGCEQLFLRPTFSFVASNLVTLVTKHYTTEIPGEPPNETLIDLEQDIEESRDMNATKDTTADIERAREGNLGGDTTLANTTTAGGEITGDMATRGPGAEPSTSELDLGMGDDLRPFDLEGPDLGGFGDGNLDLPDDATNRVIPEMPNLEGVSGEVSETQTTEEQQSNELSEEFEQRRWTKRTQQVFRMLDRGLTRKDTINFTALTQKCNRKQAASRFYTCLLLAKEGTIHVHQSEPYTEIAIQKGPKFTEAF